MLDLGTLKLGIKVDGEEEAKKSLEDVQESIKSTASDMKNKIVGGAKAAAAGFTALVGAAVGVVESTREYRTEQKKLETAFETAGHNAKAAKDTYSELNGVLGDSGQATEAANHLAKLCDNQKQLKEWTDICTGVYATFGDSLPIEGLTEAANETAKTGTLTGGLADALNWAGISEDDFQSKLNKCNTEAERQNLIQETLTKTYGKASDAYKKNAEDVIAANKANEKMEDAMAKLGETLEPVVTTVKEFVADGVEYLTTVVEEHQEDIDKFVQAIRDFGDWVIENKDYIVAGLVGIGTGLAVFKVASTIMSLVDAFRKMKAAEEGLTIAQAALNLVMNANPFILIATLVAGLIAAIVTLWNTNEDFRKNVKKTWDKIKKFFSEALEGIVKAVTGLGEDIKEAGKKIIDKLKEGIQWVWEHSLLKFITDKVCGFFKDKFGIDLKEKGKEILNSLKDGLIDAWGKIKEWVSEKVEWLSDKFSGFFDWITGKDDKKEKKDGSHRNGIEEVPFDNYKAVLHKGEMVLTAAEAKRYKQGTTNNETVNNITVNNYSPKALDEATSAREYRKTQRKIALGF